MFLSVSGHGVFFTACRPARSFVVEYFGDLITEEEGLRREADAADCSVFRFFFPFAEKKWW